MSATKISISVNTEQLRRARRAAKAEGLSLSGFIARALEKQLEEHRILEAARELWSGWGPESVPSPKERADILAKIARPRTKRRSAA
jgi:uncharacterized protein (DUF1778 family)